MKKLLGRYAMYNLWANRLLSDCIKNLEDEVLRKEVTSSFAGIYPTLLHMWDAESIWWQRIKLAEHPEWPGESFTGSVHELCVKWLQQSKTWEEWVMQSTEASLTHEFIYHNTKKEQFKQPVSDVLIHLFNHQSYHRGQIVTMLRQSGVDKIPGMDFMLFSRKVK